ncbi:hypothetical protein EIN_277030 [Entamoeba invadens IP1]|uniref:Uncharacterized protein n=1 Tax=Entamoeba invadens IP1 TaxID=370355 RepID=A0A0A1U0C1_ENTIV|nr:hypothetical protein EIN_277030 [Entamoeba invadens IP1]ELP84333.1 hypothetical protein EIN_277030 [Entamoeba invadens IP1]|eukprot:XP_004183679.1 hypothetical protein EIN_277030 [Entamoeba invadens IP1]
MDFFLNLADFKPQAAAFHAALVFGIFAMIFAIVYMIIEIYGFFGVENPKRGTINNLVGFMNLFSFIPSVSDDLIGLIYGITFTVLIGINMVLSFICLLVAVCGASFNENAGLSLPSKRVNLGFFVFIGGQVLMATGVLVITLIRFLCPPMQEEESYLPPKAQNDGLSNTTTTATSATNAPIDTGKKDDVNQQNLPFEINEEK